MAFAKAGFPVLASMTAAALLAACDGATATPPAADAQTQIAALTAADRLAACAQDPRVVAGLAT